MIVYFKKMIKHLNVEEIIVKLKMILFDNCFNEWCKNIKNMLLIVKNVSLLKQ